MSRISDDTHPTMLRSRRCEKIVQLSLILVTFSAITSVCVAPAVAHSPAAINVADNCSASPPSVTRFIKASYDEQARQSGAVGGVDVQVAISADGTVADAVVTKSSGSTALDQAALAAARQSQYAAAQSSCHPVTGTLQLTVNFSGQSETEDLALVESPAPTSARAIDKSISSQPSPRLAEITQCEQHAVTGAYKSIGMTQSDALDDGSIADAVKTPDYQYEAAQCLRNRKQYVAERAVLLALSHQRPIGSMPDTNTVSSTDIVWQLALAEEKLNMRANAIRHITSAYKAADTDVKANKKSIAIDYRRINASAIRAEEREAIKDYIASWTALSADQHDVVKAHGGTRENGLGYPCHFEQYDAPAYHSETWVYGDCDSGKYLTEYTFVNGSLHSTYSP